MILRPCVATLANNGEFARADWPNFLDGMNYTAHAWKQSACVNKDRVDGVDGWNSPVINWTQHAFHPHLVFDVASYEASPRFVTGWPRNVSTASAGATVSRELIIFNDVVDVATASFSLRWSGRWQGSASVAVHGSTPQFVRGPAQSLPPAAHSLGVQEIEAGFHVSKQLVLEVPSPPAEARAGGGEAELQLMIELVAAGSGAILFTEDRLRIAVN